MVYVGGRVPVIVGVTMGVPVEVLVAVELELGFTVGLGVLVKPEVAAGVAVYAVYVGEPESDVGVEAGGVSVEGSGDVGGFDAFEIGAELLEAPVTDAF